MYVVRRVTPDRDVSTWVPGSASCRSRHSPSWRVPAARPRRRRSTRRAPAARSPPRLSRRRSGLQAGLGRSSCARTANAHGKRAASRTGWPSPTRRAAVTARCATRRPATRSSASGGARSSSTDCGSRSDRRRRRAPSASTGRRQSVPATGGRIDVSVSAQAGCAWTARSDAPWIFITSGAAGQGSGSVSLSVSANPAAQARSTVVTIAGQPYLIEQAGAVIGGPVPTTCPGNPASRAAC